MLNARVTLEPASLCLFSCSRVHVHAGIAAQFSPGDMEGTSRTIVKNNLDALQKHLENQKARAHCPLRTTHCTRSHLTQLVHASTASRINHSSPVTNHCSLCSQSKQEKLTRNQALTGEKFTVDEVLKRLRYPTHNYLNSIQIDRLYSNDTSKETPVDRYSRWGDGVSRFKAPFTTFHSILIH